MKKVVALVIAGILVIGGLILGIKGITVIDSGQVGIVKTMGEINTDTTLTPGLNFVNPFTQSVTRFDIKTKIIEPEEFIASSVDTQSVYTSVVLAYHIDESLAANLLATVGGSYESNIITPALIDTAKATIGKFKADDVVNDRDEIAAKTVENLNAKLASYGIVVESINYTNLGFDPEYLQAAKAKQVAEQEIITAQKELQKAEVEAQRRVAEAKADAEAAKEKADAAAYSTAKAAEAEAEAVRKMQDQLANSPEYIEYFKYSQWNGQTPTVVGDGQSIIDLR